MSSSTPSEATATRATLEVDETAANTEEIKTMELYNDIERIENELNALGMKPDNPLDAHEMSNFDSMHYGGNDAVQSALDYFTTKTNNAKLTILDIGSGFGGPARYIASQSAHTVVAVELQEDIHSKAMEWTKRCGLSSKVSHVCGDILTSINDEGSFDAIVSWLTFLHIPNKQELFKVCYQMLKSNSNNNDNGDSSSHLFIEDYYQKEPFTNDELTSLQNDVYCNDLPTKEEYIQALESNGFSDIVFEDMTKEWITFVQSRLESFVSDKERFVSLHGEATHDKLYHFYDAVHVLFQGTHLGGVRISATKK
mmetsp:Transcript_2424/g.3401  ORF Transcript_2424/g.3401 Transcript_2424/m.3401 type:complete len:311 (+) Transcript_2424:151-1083(+)